METIAFIAVMALSVAGGQDKGTAAKMTVACQEQGYIQAVYVEGSGFEYECQ